MELGVEVINDRKVALRFDAFPEKARANLLQAITAATDRLRGAVESAAPKRTGKLASQIFGQVSDGATRITGSVGVRGDTGNDFAKATAEEYGAHGHSKVRPHQIKLTHIFSRVISPMEVMVEHATGRQVNIKARNYLRGPFHAMEDEVLAAMRDAVEQAALE